MHSLNTELSIFSLFETYRAHSSLCCSIIAKRRTEKCIEYDGGLPFGLRARARAHTSQMQSPVCSAHTRSTKCSMQFSYHFVAAVVAMAAFYRHQLLEVNVHRKTISDTKNWKKPFVCDPWTHARLHMCVFVEPPTTSTATDNTIKWFNKWE